MTEQPRGRRKLPSIIVDNCNNENGIAETFASKYVNLYRSFLICIDDVDKLKSSITKSIDASDHSDHSDAVIRDSEIKEAIFKLKLNESDGINILVFNPIIL